MTPAAHVRIVLGYHRELGTEFEAAWLSALRSLPKGTRQDARDQIGEWKPILAWAKEAFRAAYLGLDAPLCAQLLEPADPEWGPDGVIPDPPLVAPSLN